MGRTGIDNSWVASVFSWLLHGLRAISHALTLQGPGTEPVGEVLESFQAASASNDLGRIIATEQSIRSLVHILGGDREADHCMIDDSIILQRPQIVKFLLAHFLVRGETEDTIRILAKTLRFVEGQELEVSALLFL